MGNKKLTSILKDNNPLNVTIDINDLQLIPVDRDVMSQINFLDVVVKIENEIGKEDESLE